MHAPASRDTDSDGLLAEELLAERFTGNRTGRLDDLELTGGEGFADEHRVHEMVVGLHGDFTRGGREFLADERGANLGQKEPHWQDSRERVQNIEYRSQNA